MIIMADIQKSNVNDRLWTHIANRIQTSIAVNQAHPNASGSQNFQTDPRTSIPLTTSDDAKWAEMLNAGRAIAKYFTRITYGLYGISGNVSPAYNAYGYFYVDPARHSAHYNNVENQLTNYTAANPSPTGMTLAQVEAQYTALSNVIIANAAQETPDLRICHASCHSNCHASRGRR